MSYHPTANRSTRAKKCKITTQSSRGCKAKGTLTHQLQEYNLVSVTLENRMLSPYKDEHTQTLVTAIPPAGTHLDTPAPLSQGMQPSMLTDSNVSVSDMLETTKNVHPCWPVIYPYTGILHGAKRNEMLQPARINHEYNVAWKKRVAKDYIRDVSICMKFRNGENLTMCHLEI